MLKKIFITIMLTFASFKTYANDQIDCLAKAMYFEARGGKDHELVNIGHVILNRVDSNKFPNSVCSVIADKKHSIQFPWYYKGKSIKYLKTFKEIKILANILYNSHVNNERIDTTKGSLFFHSKRIDLRWKHYKRVSVLDNLHYFYKL